MFVNDCLDRALQNHKWRARFAAGSVAGLRVTAAGRGRRSWLAEGKLSGIGTKESEVTPSQIEVCADIGPVDGSHRSRRRFYASFTRHRDSGRSCSCHPGTRFLPVVFICFVTVAACTAGTQSHTTSSHTTSSPQVSDSKSTAPTTQRVSLTDVAQIPTSDVIVQLFNIGGRVLGDSGVSTSIILFDPTTRSISNISQTGLFSGAPSLYADGLLWTADLGKKAVEAVDPITLRAVHQYTGFLPGVFISVSKTTVWFPTAEAESPGSASLVYSVVAFPRAGGPPTTTRLPGHGTSSYLGSVTIDDNTVAIANDADDGSSSVLLVSNGHLTRTISLPESPYMGYPTITFDGRHLYIATETSSDPFGAPAGSVLRVDLTSGLAVKLASFPAVAPSSLVLINGRLFVSAWGPSHNGISSGELIAIDTPTGAVEGKVDFPGLPGPATMVGSELWVPVTGNGRSGIIDVAAVHIIAIH